MLVLKIAFRNIFRNRRRSFFSGATMCFGFVLVSISIGFSDGGYFNIIDMITRESSGHIQIHHEGYLEAPSLYKTMSDFKKLEQKIKKVPDVKNYSARIYSGALAFNGGKSMGVQLMGIYPELERSTTTLFNKLIKGSVFSSESRDVIVSKGLSELLHIEVSDNIVLISQGADGSIANDIFKISGVVDTDSSTLPTHLVVMSVSSAQDFLTLGNRIHEIAVIVNNHDQARSIVGKLKKEFDDRFNIDPWQVVQESFYKAMLVDQKGSYFSLFVIMFVVAIGVLNTVLMSVFERMREYGLLRAIGTRPIQIIKMIIYESGILAIMSIFFGIILAFVLNLWFQKNGISFDPPIEYGGVVFRQFNSVVNFKIFWIPAAVIFFTTIVVSIFPAIRAARVIPSKALKDIG